jgi:hypothetical protein
MFILAQFVALSMTAKYHTIGEGASLLLETPAICDDRNGLMLV